MFFEASMQQFATRGVPDYSLLGPLSPIPCQSNHVTRRMKDEKYEAPSFLPQPRLLVPHTEESWKEMAKEKVDREKNKTIKDK